MIEPMTMRTPMTPRISFIPQLSLAIYLSSPAGNDHCKAARNDRRSWAGILRCGSGPRTEVCRYEINAGRGRIISHGARAALFRQALDRFVIGRARVHNRQNAITIA